VASSAELTIQLKLFWNKNAYIVTSCDGACVGDGGGWQKPGNNKPDSFALTLHKPQAGGNPPGTYQNPAKPGGTWRNPAEPGGTRRKPGGNLAEPGGKKVS